MAISHGIASIQKGVELEPLIVAQNLQNNKETSGKYGILQYITRHLERTRSIAGFLLEQRRRKEKEQFVVLERGYTKAFTFRSLLDQTYLSRSSYGKRTNQVQLNGTN